MNLPRIFGNYCLVKHLASGGMGEIYAALSAPFNDLGKRCVIKTIIPKEKGGQNDFRARFRDESAISIMMNHPNIASVYEVGAVGGEYYQAMELIEGKDLGQMLTYYWKINRRLSVVAALYIVREVLEALYYCHQITDESGGKLDLIHRDVSPNNVIISYDGVVKLVDFGLAQSKRKKHRTAVDIVLGKPGYIAPERLMGLAVDHRSDIFSVGVLLFELLACDRFVPARDPKDYLRMLKQYEIKPPVLPRCDVPQEVIQAIHRATAFTKEKRFNTAAEFSDLLSKIIAKLNPTFNARHLAQETMQIFQPFRYRQELNRAYSDAIDVMVDHRPTEVSLVNAHPANDDLSSDPPSSDLAKAAQRARRSALSKHNLPLRALHSIPTSHTPSQIGFEEDEPIVEVKTASGSV